MCPVKSSTNKNKDEKQTMESLFKNHISELTPFQQGQIVEAKVIQASSSKVWADVAGLIIGVVPEREMSVMTPNLKPGDIIHAFIVDVEDEKGNMILSLRRADQERLSDDLKKKFLEGQILNVTISEANKGGLLIEVGDYQGFLPVSQLASKHYPKVEGGDPDKIYARLVDLVGQTIQAKIISFDPNNKKLIFSEKAAGDKEQEEKLSKIKEGDIVEGEVTGIVDFGIFVKIGQGEDEIEGLVHISEIAWGRVSNLNELFQVGQKVKVLIVSTEDNRVSLSIKRLQPDPWRAAAKKYKINDIVKGQVTKITNYGLFIRIDEEIDGLVHLSEISGQKIEEAAEKYEIGKTYHFRIISFDPDAHRLGLSLKLEQDEPKKEKSAEKEEAEKEKKEEKTTDKTTEEPEAEVANKSVKKPRQTRVKTAESKTETEQPAKS